MADPFVAYPPPPPFLFPELGTVEPFPDVSLDSPAQQFQYLSDTLAAEDAAHPAPFTGTPPWGEPIPEDEYLPQGVLDEQYLIAADVDASANTELLSVVSDPAPLDIPERVWSNDDQYHALGVPPGVENLDQPIEYGHTQAVPINPAAEHGWDHWTGRPNLARVARMQNDFPGYSAGVRRRMGDYPVEKMVMPYALLTQQYRDLLLAELKARGVHNAVVADVPSVPFTEQVAVIDPSVLMVEPDIGPEGVLP